MATTLPPAFTAYTSTLLGARLWGALEAGLRLEPTVSLRLNRWKPYAEVPEGAERVAWCGDGYYLSQRPCFTLDPLFHAGAYYVQEASSMFIDHVLRQHVTTPVLMLDLCAAPGGKSTAARAALPEGSLLVSNEPLPQRAQVLAENMLKQGHSEVLVTNNHPTAFGRSGLRFNVVLTDVPCSGEGMFRKDEGAINEWSPQTVSRCAALQREIIGEAWRCLKPGGLLIYSTCTFNATENEDNIVYAINQLGAEPVGVDIEPQWGIVGSLVDHCHCPVYRFLPGVAKGEGLFMAVLRKPEEGGSDDSNNDNNSNNAIARRLKQAGKGKGSDKGAGKLGAVHSQCLAWLAEPNDYCLVANGTELTAVPRRWADTYHMAAATLNIVSAAVPLATVKGRDAVPAHGLALSTALRSDAFPRIALSHSQAIAYLRRESLAVEGAPRGYVVLTYKGCSLGFGKSVGSRINNLYPQHWRIRMGDSAAHTDTLL